MHYRNIWWNDFFISTAWGKGHHSFYVIHVISIGWEISCDKNFHQWQQVVKLVKIFSWLKFLAIQCIIIMAPWNEVYIETRRYVVHIAVRCVTVMVNVISCGCYSSPVGGTTVISSGETLSKCWSTNQTSVSSSETVRAARQTTPCQFGERKTLSLSLSLSLSLCLPYVHM